MGAWIETSVLSDVAASCIVSHPTWVRGLKQRAIDNELMAEAVAPYVGAWIETLPTCMMFPCNVVAPYVGAWIET